MFKPIKDRDFVIDPRNYKHREVSLSPVEIYKKRKFIYILTDRPSFIADDFLSTINGLINNLDNFTNNQIAESAFYIYFSTAESATPFIKRIIKCRGLFIPPPIFSKVSFSAVSLEALNTYNETGLILDNNPFGGIEVHMQICQAVELTKNVLGDFVEIGVYSGSSALTALNHMKKLKIKRKCYLLDTFSGFVYKEAEDSSDILWNETHLMEKDKTIERIESIMQNTQQNFKAISCNICTDPLPEDIKKIALANIDVDMYESTLNALYKVGPLMVKRGIIICEDPTSTPGLYGAYVAMNEFLESSMGRDFMAIRTSTQYFLIKIQE